MAIKKKILNYLLILLAAGVWGTIVYRIYAAVGNDDEPAKPISGNYGPAKISANDYAPERDTGVLQLNFRDPFSEKPLRDSIHRDIRPSALRSAPKPLKSTVNWGIIKYSGYMRNPVTKKLLAILNINGKSVTLAEGEQAEQVRLLKNFGDSVRVSYQGALHNIQLN